MDLPRPFDLAFNVGMGFQACRRPWEKRLHQRAGIVLVSFSLE